MRTPLALYNLMHGKWRTVISTSGVAVAIILVFMQLGFLSAVIASANLIYDNLAFDVLVRSPDYYHFCDPREFPRSYLYQLKSLPDVESVKPLYATLATWRIPANEQTESQETRGQLRGILAMGIDPTENVFLLPEIHQQRALLLNPQNLLLDTKTKGDDFGAINGREFSSDDVGQSVEIWDKKFHVAGLFQLGAGLAANGSVVMSSAGYGRFFPSDTVNNVNYGLVDLKPGVDADQFCQRVRAQLATQAGGPSGSAAPVAVLTRHEVRKLEQERWLWYTPVGAIFAFGVLVALVVGGVVVYMVLSNDVSNHIHEYATLRAMGYPDLYLSGVVMQQAIAMAILGYGASLVCAEVLYRLVGYWANLPMVMSWSIRLLVLALSVGMCCISGVATLRKLRAVAPADLF